MRAIPGPDGSVEIDRVGQRLLYALWRAQQDADDVQTTSHLCEQLDLAQNQIARHRLKNELTEADLVAHDGTRDTGGPMPADCWTITPRGSEWVVNNIEDVHPPQTLAEACDELRRLANEVESIKERLAAVEGRAGRNKRSVSDLDDDLDLIEEQYRQVREDLPELQDRLNSHKNAILQHKEHLGYLYTELDIEIPDLE